MLNPKYVLCLFLAAYSAINAQAAQVNWSHNVESALQEANQSRRLVFMKFTADWCGYCKKMERETFTRPTVADFVNKEFVPVLVDADKHRDLVQHLKIRGFPAMLIVSPEMVILERISGYQTEEKLMPMLRAAIAKHGMTAAAQTKTASTSPQETPSAKVVSQPKTQPPAASVFNPNVRQTASKSAPSPAFGGLCLPGVRETRSLISGRPEWTTRYRGKTLYFSDGTQRQNFLDSPEKYWPQEDGHCPVMLLEQGRLVEGRLEYAAMFRGKLWVMHNAAAMRNFVSQPARYVEAVHRAKRVASTKKSSF